MLNRVVSLRRAREAVQDAKASIGASMVIAVVALIVAALALILGVRSEIARS